MKKYPNQKRFDPADVMDSEEKEEPMETKPSNEVSDVLYGLDSVRLKGCEDNSHILPEGFQMQPPSCASGLLEYSMTSNTRGIGVIINNCKFHDSINNNLPDLERKGAHHDTGMLFDNHGRGNSLIGSDCSEISVEAVREIFRIEKCPSLSGKPKIFFIQACNGQNLEGIQLAQTYQEDSFPDSIKPAKSDELIGYSTVDDHASFRAIIMLIRTPQVDFNWSSVPHTGANETGEIVVASNTFDIRQGETFDICTTWTELCQILTKVNQKVGDQFMRLKDGLVGKQMPKYESTLMKLLYLKD
ncbi:hypothetical protein FSP39_023225 [Pinctada imbricata]|uniref:Caspase-3 n=1 Tax=Pinctada imbricata TaxID=66713 RepID=A0AA88YPN2_PINIB|nr:hypothetical protein FSP39_023225 [Pinctada imbricata]